MGVTATAPLLLLVIPLVVGLVVGLQLLAKRSLGDARTGLALLVRALLISALAMALAGVTKDTPNPPGGEILKDAQGDPIGVFRETAAGLLGRAQRASRATSSTGASP